MHDPSIFELNRQFAAKISYTGPIDKKELRRWYRIADVGVIPSFSEQCSYAGIEMMMHGLPIVASDGFGVRNMFQDGVNARTAQIGNRKKPKEFISSLTDALLELLSSESLCSDLGKSARQMYLSRYLPEKMFDKYKKLLDDLSIDAKTAE